MTGVGCVSELHFYLEGNLPFSWKSKKEKENHVLVKTSRFLSKIWLIKWFD